MFLLLLILQQIWSSHCTLYIDGPCPNVSAVDSFNVTRFAQGIWYEIARYQNDWEGDEDCAYLAFDEESKNFKAVGVSKKKSIAISGYVDYAKNAGNKGMIIFRSNAFNGAVEKDFLPVYIMAIDYDKYVIGYECKYDEATKKRHDFVWIDSRTKILDSETKKVLDDIVIKTSVINETCLIWDHFTDESCKSNT